MSAEKEIGLSFWEHLDELRSVLLKSLSAWLAGFVAAFCCKDWLFGMLFAPTQPDFILYRGLCRMAERTGWDVLCPSEVAVDFLNTELTAQFMTHIRVSLWAGLIAALPFITYQLYRFVSPALYESERRYSVRLVVVSMMLFAAGVCLSYLLIFPLSFRFLNSYQVTDMVVNHISLSSYISLFIVLTLLMGLLFEIPVLTWLLEKMGLLHREQLKQYRRYVFVDILILAALITPTGDPFTLLLVTTPIYLLYELSIALVPASAEHEANK